MPHAQFTAARPYGTGSRMDGDTPMRTFLTARLDESYTHFVTGERVTRERRTTFEVKQPENCDHDNSHICAECAPSWQHDYEFGEPFPFERVQRVSVADLLTAGKLTPGARLEMKDTDIIAVITDTGGIMLPDLRVFDNPSAAAHAVLES
ncbi:hypothetical protein [Nocardia sp. NPDC052566]|uniref:hypothetical protein n=1 Tax=Nocardia sp. NPDC052566 TaxID=3364330 RepID=UPI0037C52C60